MPYDSNMSNCLLSKCRTSGGRCQNFSLCTHLFVDLQLKSMHVSGCGVNGSCVHCALRCIKRPSGLLLLSQAPVVMPAWTFVFFLFCSLFTQAVSLQEHAYNIVSVVDLGDNRLTRRLPQGARPAASELDCFNLGLHLPSLVLTARTSV